MAKGAAAREAAYLAAIGAPRQGGARRRRKPGRTGTGQTKRALERAERQRKRAVVRAALPTGKVARRPMHHDQMLSWLARLCLNQPDRLKRLSGVTFEYRACHQQCPGAGAVYVSRPSPAHRRQRSDVSAAPDIIVKVVDLVEQLGGVSARERTIAQLQQQGVDGCCPADRGQPRSITIRGGMTKSTVILYVWWPCKVCPHCRRQKKRMWFSRILSEIKAAEALGGRTWFGTLTFPADIHCRSEYFVDSVLRSQEIDFAQLSPERQFAAREAALLPEVTKFLKRLRALLDDRAADAEVSNNISRIRFVRACEPHNGDLAGYPHWHVLIHEQDPMFPLRKDDLESQWGRTVVSETVNRFGKTCPVYERLSHWRLIDANDRRAIGYCVKYVQKGGRIRASLHYGDRSGRNGASDGGTLGSSTAEAERAERSEA